MNPVFLFGDSILDRDVFVSVSDRGSEDSLAPLVVQQNEKYSMGGVGRVAASVRRFGSSAHLFVPIGNGEFDREYARRVAASGAELQLKPQPNFSVSVKNRFWTVPEQRMILRHDADVRSYWDERETQALLHFCPGRNSLFCVVDHDKGFCNSEFMAAIMDHVGRRGNFCVVDPGNKDYLSRYAGKSTVFKFNAMQAQRFAATQLPTPKIFCGQEPQERTNYFELNARMLSAFERSKIEYAAFWITLGPGGCIWQQPDRDPVYVPACRDHAIVDTCGAGDEALASFVVGFEPSMLADKDRIRSLLAECNERAAIACSRKRFER